MSSPVIVFRVDIKSLATLLRNDIAGASAEIPRKFNNEFPRPDKASRTYLTIQQIIVISMEIRSLVMQRPILTNPSDRKLFKAYKSSPIDGNIVASSITVRSVAST